MKQVFFCLYFFLFPYLLFAQTGSLSGSVKDAETGDPMVGATVSIIGTYKGAFTDNAGNFRISGIKAGDYNIKFTFVGYSEKQYNGISIVAGQTKRLEVELKSTVTTLGEVEIVGERGLLDLESGQSSTKISAAELGEMSVNSVQDVVAMQVGVQENPDGIQIRGGRVYETEYVVDGINAQDPLAGTGLELK